MKFCPENKCSFCAKLFCCVKCRIKHEISVHFSLPVEFISCDLCNGSERVVLQQHNTDNFINHLFTKHLPLQCRNCSVIFQNKDDLVTLHTCVPSKNIENEKLGLKMVLEGEQKIEPIIEEETEQVNEAEKLCGNVKTSYELLAIESGKQRSKPFDASVAENGSLIRSRSVSSINNSENSNKTPLNNLVRQTSTPMTKMIHEAKGCYSMSASSIQMSSIENCSSEHDISPPLPVAPPLNTFKQPSRRMPVAVTPYRQIMSKSIQRAFTSHGLSRARCVDGTPPLDLRTSPVIRRTISIEGNARPPTRPARPDVNTIDLRTTPVIRRTQIEATNMAAIIDARAASRNETLNDYEQSKPSDQNVRNSIQESLQKSSLSRSKSTNTFFETCRSFETSVTSSHPIETPKTTGISKRSASFSSRRNMKETKGDKEQWFTPSPERSENIQTPSSFKSPDDPSKSVNEDKRKDEVFVEPNKGTLWSFVSYVFRKASLGGTADTNTPSNDDSDSASLIKRCASFTGILPPRKPPINSVPEESPYKRRRTTTLSEIENKLGEDNNISGRRGQRISGRPPIDRMRQS